MSTTNKFQAGESYGDARKKSSSSFLSDPVRVASDLFKDYATLRSEASLTEVVGLIKGIMNEGEPIDDKKGTPELLTGILAALPSDSETRFYLTSKLIDTLWGFLQHPPLTYVGGDVKYEVVNSKEKGGNPTPKAYDTIEFTAPGSDIRLREQVPQAPDGLHQYRMPDGSFNNILEPNLGKAGTPYAKTVKSTKRLHGVRPDASLLFDLLMAREEDDSKENEAGLSSMLFYHASIIIHDIFRTRRTDMNKSDTSSYLDLAPLYGSSLTDQLEIRTMVEGKLKPDTFHEKRLLGQPAGVNVMLVLYSRFHNYVADILLKINENGRFTLACTSDASPEDQAKAKAKQDHDLFNTARLIVGGMYINICLHDYLRAATNTHHSDSDWTLDPRIEIGKQYDGEGVPRGVGNQVSVEFNLLYRFHSCISKKDERWMNDFFLKLFPGRKADDLENISWHELGAALVDFEKKIPKDPSARTFAGLERQADNTFKDEDLARILKEAMDDPAGAFGARRVPKALKIVEVQGILQARKWQVASLNEFRDFFGLKRHEKFTDINKDPDIAHILEKLYTDPDMVELYPGLMLEDIKPARNAGSGLCPPFTAGRAVLADAITLVRSDRFYTIDYNVATLTNWGHNEVQQDYKTLGGSMLYKLIQRGLPGWFPFNSVAVMQPMYTKKMNETIAKEIGTIKQYTLDDPRPPRKRVVLTTAAAIKQVLGNTKQFVVPWLSGLNNVFPGEKDFSWFMLAGDEPRNFAHRASFSKAMGKVENLHGAVHNFVQNIGKQIIDQETFQLKEGLNQIDLIRDVAIPLNARLLADLFYLDMRSDENPTGSLSSTELYRHLINLRIWCINNDDPAQAWNRRRRAQEGAKVMTKSTRQLVDEVVLNRGYGFGITNALSHVASRRAYLKKGSLRSCGYQLAEQLLAQGSSSERATDELYLSAFAGVGVPVTLFYEVMEYFLRPENAAIWAEVQVLAKNGAHDLLHEYVKEAQRLTSTQRNLRVATQPAELEGKSVEPGNIVIMLLGEAGRDPKEVSDHAKFNPKRASDGIRAYGYGQHGCLGKEVSDAFVTGLVQLVADLKQLRPAPGQMGRVKTINLPTGKAYLNDSWSYLAFDASTWKVHFNGHGQGNYEGNREPTDPIDIQQHYYSLLKRKGGS